MCVPDFEEGPPVCGNTARIIWYRLTLVVTPRERSERSVFVQLRLLQRRRGSRCIWNQTSAKCIVCLLRCYTFSILIVHNIVIMDLPYFYTSCQCLFWYCKLLGRSSGVCFLSDSWVLDCVIIFLNWFFFDKVVSCFKLSS